jgi:hypothetical protein
MIRDHVLPPRAVENRILRGEIFAAEVLSYLWRQTPANPTGLCIRIGIEIADRDGYAHLFDAIDIANRGRLASAFASAGLAMPRDGIDSAIADLVGRRAAIVPKLITPRQGKHAGIPKSVVGQWLMPAAADVVSH